MSGTVPRLSSSCGLETKGKIASFFYAQSASTVIYQGGTKGEYTGVVIRFSVQRTTPQLHVVLTRDCVIKVLAYVGVGWGVGGS